MTGRRLEFGIYPLSVAGTPTEERQREVIATIIRTVQRVAAQLNVTHYMFFGLRDADSTAPDPFHRFGILRDDYTPKPAYATFKSLIAELSRASRDAASDT